MCEARVISEEEEEEEEGKPRQAKADGTACPPCTMKCCTGVGCTPDISTSAFHYLLTPLVFLLAERASLSATRGDARISTTSTAPTGLFTPNPSEVMATFVWENKLDFLSVGVHSTIHRDTHKKDCR